MIITERSDCHVSGCVRKEMYRCPDQPYYAVSIHRNSRPSYYGEFTDRDRALHNFAVMFDLARTV